MLIKWCKNSRCPRFEILDEQTINGILKCHYDQILDNHFFYIFLHNRSFKDILPHIKSITNITKRVFCYLYFREFSAAINFPCCNSLL